ncbi:VWA domain-containing protein [Ferruginibacter sp. HRS2-29]|uniref:VWA domain-containing protein n=1 Tax=Ferruginibacter sp. HRS2-29 TaxID=2487334 RepID=UPI0020CFA1D2|nr:VWA domain-containing protein [Ferruginibacter sp. HRS2-29]
MLIVFLVAKNRKKKTITKIGEPLLVKQLLAQYRAASFFKKFIVLFVAMAALILALANPRSATGNNLVDRNGIDVMIAIDVSKSMLAQDIKPTRLDRAKQLLGKLIDKLGNDRIGIVVFAGKAYLQMPLTGDHAAAKMYLSAASTESIPTQGTVIGDALKMCYASFNTKEKKYKAVILISDGEDHDEGAISTAKQMGSEGVVIYTIGIGSKEGAPIIDEATGAMKKDAEGNTVISKLNEEELQSIAQSGNGAYQFFGSTDNVVNNLAHQLASMDQRAVKDESLTNYQSYFQVLLAIALLLLVIELFISETKRNKLSRLKPAAVSFLFMLAGTAAMAQENNKTIKEGNEAYGKKDYSRAASSYEKVVKKDSNNLVAQYNLGSAYYKSGRKDSAIEAYDRSIRQSEKPVQKSNAYYNKGVVLQNDKKLAECIEAYKAALRLTPNDDDARQNLQKALQQQKQQQQQQKQEQKKEDKKDEKPKPQPSKMTPRDAEEKLKALQQQEKNLQDKLHKVNANAPNKPEKDW